MAVNYQFNSLREREVRGFFIGALGLELNDSRYLPTGPACGYGRLMQTTIGVDDSDTLIGIIRKKDRQREWDTLPGMVVD